MPLGNLAERRESVIIFLILAIFLIVNVATASLSPTVWIDEVMFSDPAINLHLKRGFTSTAWYAQQQDRFWSGNAPLHSMLLSVWLLIAPISPTGVRSINFIYVSAAVFIFWQILRRASVITEPLFRLLFALLALTGYGIAFSYRSGRYDALGILLVALITLAAIKTPLTTLRLLALGGLCALLPWAGLHLLIFAFMVIALHGLAYASIDKRHVIASAGVVGGAVILLAFLLWMGTLVEFAQSVTPHTSAHSARSVENTLSKLKSIPQLFYQDPSVALLLPVLPIAFMATKGQAEKRKLVIFLSFCIFIIPLALHIAGKFTTYYSWIIFIPLCVITALAAQHARPRKAPLYFILGLSTASCALGLPARIAVSVLDREARDHRIMSNYVSEAIKTGDTAYIDFAAYYPAKLKAAAVFLPPYLQIISPSERAAVTVAVLQGEIPLKDSTRFLSNAFGGNWVRASATFAPTRRDELVGIGLASPYTLNVYRRNFGP